MQSPEKLVRFIPNAGNPFSRSEAKNSSPRLTPWAFLCLRSGQGSWVETCCTTRQSPSAQSPEPD
nr:MAG TPA: GAGA binding protein-like family [Caudoviricetes sp.]